MRLYIIKGWEGGRVIKKNRSWLRVGVSGDTTSNNITCSYKYTSSVRMFESWWDLGHNFFEFNKPRHLSFKHWMGGIGDTIRTSFKSQLSCSFLQTSAAELVGSRPPPLILYGAVRMGVHRNLKSGVKSQTVDIIDFLHVREFLMLITVVNQKFK